MRKNWSIVLLLLLIFGKVESQNLELGKVSLAEVEQKQHPKYPDAEAAILFMRGATHFEYSGSRGFYIITEVETRIKIYKKEGYKWANKIIPHYTGENEDENVTFSKAVTYNVVDGQIQKTKLKSEGEFKERLNKSWSLKKIALPDIREGSVVEFKYTITSPYMSTLYDWSFQEDIPVEYSEYKTLIPDFFKYNLYWKGSLQPSVTSNSIKRDFAGVQNDMVNKAGGFRFSRGNYSFDCREINTTYILASVPPLKDESYVNNITNYRQSVSHELASVMYPEEPVRFIANDWEAVTNKIYSHPDFGYELGRDGYYAEDLAQLNSGSDEEKLFRIYFHLQNRMTWNGQNSYLCDVGVRRAYLEKSGNTAEINLILVSMLRKAGLNANPVILSTRDNGIAAFPSRSAFNYVVASVATPKGNILLDATDKRLSPGELPVRALNWVGRVIGENGRSESVGLKSLNPSKENINIMVSLSPEGRATGKMRQQYLDYGAYVFRKRYFEMGKEPYQEWLERNRKGLEISEYQLANESDLGKPVIETISFSDYPAAEKIDSRLYVSPMLFLAETVNPFKQEKREYPMDFAYPQQQKVTISLTIPDGYTIEFIPQPAAIDVDEICDLRYNLTQSGKQVQISCSVNINQPIIGSDYYDSLKKFYQALIDKQGEKIILKKT